MIIAQLPVPYKQKVTLEVSVQVGNVFPSVLTVPAPVLMHRLEDGHLDDEQEKSKVKD